MKKMIIVFSAILFLLSISFGQLEDGAELDLDSLRLMEEIDIDELFETIGAEFEPLTVGERDGREYGEYRFSTGQPMEVAHSGPFTFVANMTSIEVLNIADHGNPQHLLSYPINALGVYIQGGYIYVTSEPRGLDIYSYDAESNVLEHISNFRHSPYVRYRYIEVSGIYAYIS